MKEKKSLPLSLKILSIVLFLWVIMSAAVLVMMPEREITFFGFLLTGSGAAIVVILLDIISPLLFIYTVFKKINWGANFGMLYNGIFILNSIIAFFTFREVFGNALYFPLFASIIFFYIIYRERNYFS